MYIRFNTLKAIFPMNQQGRTHRRARQLPWHPWRQVAVATVLSLALGACSSNSASSQGKVGFVEGFLGGVVADEPRAALVGRDILSAGGSAADAAAAMYFTMAVTLPSRAGLGGGGVCVAFDAASGKAEALDFTAPAPNLNLTAATRPSAIPSSPRGIFALHARHGRLQWREVVTHAEQLARFGHPVSRAFARDIAAVGPALLADPNARAVYGNASGQLVNEGETIKALDLAATLGLIRARGVGPFYTGPFANSLVKAVNSAGGSLSVETLRGYTPKWRKTVRVDVGNEVAHFAPLPAAASTQAAVMLAMLQEDGGFDGASAGTQAQLMAEVSLRSFADREAWLGAQGGQNLTAPSRIDALVHNMREDQRTALSQFKIKPRDRHENPSSTVFSAVDPLGNAVSCAVTMNAAFGTGRIAPGTGVLLAAAPDSGGRGSIGLAPMLVVNENSNEFRFAGGASGGVAAPAALASVAARVLLGEENLEAAIAQPRVHLSGAPDVTYYEQNLDAAALQMLNRAGHQTQATSVIGSVNAIVCPDGLPSGAETCRMAVDPRGQGLASGSMH